MNNDVLYCFDVVKDKSASYSSSEQSSIYRKSILLL